MKCDWCGKEIIKIEMEGVREYAEYMPVRLIKRHPCYMEHYESEQRWVIDAVNEGGHNGTEVDLVDLLRWLKENRPELLEDVTLYRLKFTGLEEADHGKG